MKMKCMDMRAYREIGKPSNLQEIEGRCPLCHTVMDKTKSISHGGRIYSFDFPLYLCISHYHGYFRWLGSKGHVRVLFPEVLRKGRVIGESPKDSGYDLVGLISIQCDDCGFRWEEMKIPHAQTFCPDCGKTMHF